MKRLSTLPAFEHPVSGGRDEIAAPLVIIVGGEHGTCDGITNHVPDGVRVAHVPDAAQARSILDRSVDQPFGRDADFTVSCFGMELRLVSRLLLVGERSQALSDLVFRLLRQLMLHPDVEISAEDLRREVWELDGADTLIVRQGVRRLRIALEKMGAPACVEWTGCGYRLVRRTEPHRCDCQEL